MGAWLLDTPEAWLVWVPVLLLVTTIDTVQLPFQGYRQSTEDKICLSAGEAVAARPGTGAARRLCPGDNYIRRGRWKPAAVRFMPLLLARVKVIVVADPG
ncbi:MAG: hypothetical protein IPQ16_14930 [Geobacteraceae bacterium]|nr:hypothetical protein [Geobacteraceae bacterium]